MRLCTALLLLSAAVSPLQVDAGTTTCQVARQHGLVVGQCPLNLTSVQSDNTLESYTVTVRVLMTSDDLCNSPKIEIPRKVQLTPTLKKRRLCKTKTKNKKRRQGETPVTCVTEEVRNISSTLWALVHKVFTVRAGTSVSVFYNAKSTNCSVTHTVPDPVPDFEVTLNQSSKSITITVETGEKVFARWCYKRATTCDGSRSPRMTIDPRVSPSATFSLPYLLPCVCVQVYYTYRDAMRSERCPFKDKGIVDVRDVWRSSEVTAYQSKLVWSYKCPADDLNMSAALCWSQRGHCTPAANSSLQKLGGPAVEFDTSAADKHPQMCVQFFLPGSNMSHCPFKLDTPSWEVEIGPGRRSVSVYLTSSAPPAKFSAQLCLLSESGCTPTGPIQSVTVEKSVRESSIDVPFHFFAPSLCVQVWQSHPVLRGRRILCPDYVHSRRGMYAVAALVFVMGAALLAVFIRSVAKRGAAGWLQFQRPLLLVCSSDQAAHVSAVCALASILHEELGAPVHTSLWAQSSRSEAGAGVADLGPLPWLYGQWEAVCEAQGKVLIIWSPEAKRTFEKWREERTNVDKKHEDPRKECRRHEKAGVKQDLKLSERILGKCKKEKVTGKNGSIDCDQKDQWPLKESSAVIEPVFMAALACLEAALQKCKGQVAAIVYFQGLAHSRDIPKALRGVARYGLPQDLRGLIQELGEVRKQTKVGQFRWHCWPRLLSKVLSMWLARQLARRLQRALPQTPGPSVSSPAETTSDKTARSRLGLQTAGSPASAAEHEPLHGSPWRAEELRAQVSLVRRLFCCKHDPGDTRASVPL